MKLVLKQEYISVLLIIFIILGRLSYFKFFEGIIPYVSTNGFPAIIDFVVILLLLYLYNGEVSKALIYEIVFLLLIATIGALRGIIYNDLAITRAAVRYTRYAYTLLAIPLYMLLDRNEWSFRQFLKTLVFLCAGSYIFRIGLSLVWSSSGIHIFEGIVYESATDHWIRNGVRRINPPCLSLLYVPIVYYLIITTERKRSKEIYSLLMILDIFYAVTIHMARSTTIYHLLVIYVMFMFSDNNIARRFRNWLLGIGILVFALQSELYKKTIESFSLSSDVGNNTRIRLIDISYVMERLSEHPVFGVGMLYSNELMNTSYLVVSDIGFFQSIYPFGYIMALWYVVVFIRALYVYKKIKYINSNLSLLIGGMTLCIILTGINIDCFFDVYAFSVPFYLAIVEYSFLHCDCCI